jgi:hypothetical protein
MPKKIVKSKKGKKEDLKEEFRKMLIESIMKDGKKKKIKECTSNCKAKKVVKKSTKRRRGGDDFQSTLFVPRKGTKKVERSEIDYKHSNAMFGGDEFNTQVLNTSPKAHTFRMRGGDNFVKDLQRAGKGVGLAIGHTFKSMSNLGLSLQCEVDSIQNIGRELDLGYTKDCPYVRSTNWEYSKIKQ